LPVPVVTPGGCADGVFGAVWAFWELQGDAAHPQMFLRNAPVERMTLAPTATVDVDGDGHVELLFDNSSDYNAQNATGQPTSSSAASSACSTVSTSTSPAPRRRS